MGLFGAAWDRELEGVAFMVQTLSRDWVNYERAEFLQKMPGTWHGATAEDQDEVIIIRNPGLYTYFEFHFFFPVEAGQRMQFLIARGLDTLRDLWIVGNSGEAICRLKAAAGTSVSREAQKAARTLEKRFGVRLGSE